MKRAGKISFFDSKDLVGPYMDSIDGLKEFDYRVLSVEGFRSSTIRTRSERDWKRDAFFDEKTGSLHIISYDDENESYLLESAFRVGKGYQRREAKSSVEEIKEHFGDSKPSSLEDIVVLLSERLEYSMEGFEYRPPVPKLERKNPRISPEDPLFRSRGLESASEESRGKVRDFLINADVIDKEDLPEGVMREERRG